jgi:glycosyl-4,4'-diaponeurosporenoate acyltransferase
MIAFLWAANVLGWPILHIAIGSIALRVPSQIFARDTWLTAPRPWEQDGDVYRYWLAIRKWKHLLPDGAPWLGGFTKKKLLCGDPTCIAQFLIETRRAEIAHWFMFACLPIFFIWNPPWARWVMTAYALAANIPCILVQRYNRFTLNRIARIGCPTLVHP